MASKSELKRQKRALERKTRERETKRAAADARRARREAAREVSPAVPMWRRAGQWLGSLTTVPPAIANDEILYVLARSSLLLRGVYKSKPTAEIGIALQALDTLGTGLSGARIPEAWDLVAAKQGDGDADGRGDDQGAKGAEGVDPSNPGLDAAEPGVEVLDVTPVAAHGGDGGGDSVQPVLDPSEGS